MPALCLLGLLARVAHGQAISIATFTQAQGLGSLEDNCLVQDQLGYVYVCTENGLFRFNGHEFERIGKDRGLTSSFISSLFEDSRHRLWVGTQSGLFVGNGDQFELASSAQPSFSVDPGATLTELDGQIYVVSRHRLWRVSADRTGWQMQPVFDEPGLHAHPQLQDVGTTYAARGQLWFGCGNTLCSKGPDGLHIYTPADGVPADTWTSYLLARDGVLWARSPHFIRTLAPGAKSFDNRDLAGAHVVTAYLELVQDERGRVLTRADKGLARWSNGQWETLGVANGLPDIGIDALLYDRDHVLWIGTYGRGVLQWRGYDNIENWQADQGLDSSPTWAIARAGDGSLWLGDELGGSMLAPGANRLQPWPVKAPADAQEATGMHRMPSGDMLVAYYSGELLLYHKDSGRTELVAKSPEYVRGMVVDSQQRAWLATERGMYVYEHGQIHRAGEGVVPDQSFTDIDEDAQGRIWCSGDAGLFRLDQEHWVRISIKGPPTDKTLGHMAVLPDGQIYLAGAFDGLWHGQINNGNTITLKHVGDALLDSTRIYFIGTDRRGWIWTGGTDGAEFFDGKQWHRLTEDDGLVWDDISEYGFFEDADGSIWIGTSNGIAHILQPEKLTKLTPLVTRIAGLSINGERQPVAADYRWKESSSKSIAIDLASFGEPARSTLQFRYRLQGLETEWVSSEHSRVDYPPLPPGDYIFQALSYNPDSRQSSPIAELSLHVMPPWWQRLPALIGMGVLALLLIALTWHQRTRRLRARARQLERLVALRTRELEDDKQALEVARTALWHQANHDALTGLPNRARILETLSLAVQHSQSAHEPLAVAIVDLDHFKDINDRYGHLAGDAVLVEAAKRLQDALPPGATLGRYGGEEMLAVMPGVAVGNSVPFENLRIVIAEKPLSKGAMPILLTCSLGVSWLDDQTREGVDMIRRADHALYQAKAAGRNRVVLAGQRDPQRSRDRPQATGP